MILKNLMFKITLFIWIRKSSRHPVMKYETTIHISNVISQTILENNSLIEQ